MVEAGGADGGMAGPVGQRLEGLLDLEADPGHQALGGEEARKDGLLTYLANHLARTFQTLPVAGATLSLCPESGLEDDVEHKVFKCDAWTKRCSCVAVTCPQSPRNIGGLCYPSRRSGSLS